MNAPAHYKLCSTCKKPIAFGADYYKCSVSTCNRKATALYFCSVPCWDAHVPDARHRDAWAEKETAPLVPDDAPAAPEADRSTSMRRVVSARPGSDTRPNDEDDATTGDVLVVMSKLKAHIKARDMRTSDGVAEPLSNHLRALCARAIDSARANQRGTVMARDIEAALAGTVAKD